MSQELDDYGLYYTNTWIGIIAETRAGSGKGTRRQPLYSIESWNQYHSILSGGVSNTNSVESFNRTWNMMVGSNPNIWKVCELFKKQESESRRILLSTSVGQDLTSNSGRKERSVSSRQQIKLIV